MFIDSEFEIGETIWWTRYISCCNRISIFWMEQIELCKIVSVNVIKYLGEFYFKKEMWFHFCCLHNITECWQHLFIEHTDYKSNSQREISCCRTVFHNEIKQFINSHLNTFFETKIYHPMWIGKIFSIFYF